MKKKKSLVLIAILLVFVMLVFGIIGFYYGKSTSVCSEEEYPYCSGYKTYSIINLDKNVGGYPVGFAIESFCCYSSAELWFEQIKNENKNLNLSLLS